MIAPIAVIPIGFVRGGRVEPIDDTWGAVEADIHLDAERFTPDATAGLEGFSHVTVIFHFHLVAEDEIETAARHPRGRKDWPEVGIFAQRTKGRPNRLGVSTAQLLKVDGLRLRVRGLDAIDGTPVLDIKPFMSGFEARGHVDEPAWARELMLGYW